MSLIIAHRANLHGPDPDTENSPRRIHEALKLGFDVEIDLWVVDSEFFLGHDQPQYKIVPDFLKKKGMWIHCKNVDALKYVSTTDLHYFWHQGDDFTLTSKNVVWTLVGVSPPPNSICVMPEKYEEKVDISGCKGVCTDYPVRFKDFTYPKQIMLSLFRPRLDLTKYVVAT